jgi:hypothetical protein
MLSEQESVDQILKGIHKGEQAASRLIYDKNSKTIRRSTGFEDPDNTISITKEDLGVWVR